MRHLDCARLHEGRAGRGARDVVAAGGMIREAVEAIDEAQHISRYAVGLKRPSAWSGSAMRDSVVATDP
jgi:hypothetical protein